VSACPRLTLHSSTSQFIIASRFGQFAPLPAVVRLVFEIVSTAGYLRSLRICTQSSSNFFPHWNPGSMNSLISHLRISCTSRVAAPPVQNLDVMAIEHRLRRRKPSMFFALATLNASDRMGRLSRTPDECITGASDGRPDVYTEFRRTLRDERIRHVSNGHSTPVEGQS
jgi:hypothetical protein